MLDILSHVEIEVVCSACEERYFVPASTVLESQQLMAAGCPGDSSYECAPEFYATLVEPEALAQLAAAWNRVEQSARTHGNARPVLDNAGRVDEKRAEARAIARWEDDGGAPEVAKK